MIAFQKVPRLPVACLCGSHQVLFHPFSLPMQVFKSDDPLPVVGVCLLWDARKRRLLFSRIKIFTVRSNGIGYTEVFPTHTPLL